MSAPVDPVPSGAERAARDAVRALSRPRAGEAFRARLREEFTSGRIASREPLVPPRAWYARPAALAPLAAAAALVLVLAANRGPEWSVVAAGPGGTVVVNGRAVPPAEPGEWSRQLARGAHVVLRGGATLDLVAPGSLALSLGNGADVELPPAPNRWWSRSARLRMAGGDAFLETGARFAGASLRVETSMADVEVTGTSLAVLDAGDATCVCVMEGRVEVRSRHDGSRVVVPAGMRRLVHGQRAAETLPIAEHSEHELHRLHAATKEALAR